MVLLGIFWLRCQIFASLRRNDFQVSKDNLLLALKPEIPVGGCLSLFLENWKKITTDQWILDTIKDGYKLEVLKIPPVLGIKHTVVSSQKRRSVEKECNRICPRKRKAVRFLPYAFSGPKEKRETETTNKFTTSESVSQKETFQNGHTSESYRSSKTRRLGSFPTCSRRIPAHTDIFRNIVDFFGFVFRTAVISGK